MRMGKHATFRFYEELNDFLPKGKRKADFIHSFKGSPSVKDVIEAIGVPHVEVDLILVNGCSVDFAYRLKDNDIVSVYPVFETLNISGITHLRGKYLRISRFVADVHLGKLVKHLGMCGFDTAYRNDYDDKTIIEISLNEHRIILTRDVGLLKDKRISHSYFLRSQSSNDQLTEVLCHFDLFGTIDPFNRCISCNGELEVVEKEKIMQQLEPNTRKYFNEFFRCRQCGKVFWKGSHYERMDGIIISLKNRE